ncbi:hypothetical protein pdam_00022253 [Pocillopora damicornis]|uniref:G-protein coupled receptors family 1 profile domain-containing protein n=1 Tax=Pocillopora damicornis TaxID=46731 RepID=A0A3M6U0Q2_POCDA|nr:hypothetical protein pdam_00022253 [Pocillopora damicornis]
METWFWVLGWFLSILTMVVNGFVIFLVCSRRQLRTKTNTFIVSLAVADFVLGMIAFCSLATECNRSKEGLIVTFVRQFTFYTSGTNLVSLELKRYVAVVKPLKYLTFMTRRRVIQMVVTSWGIPFLFIFTLVSIIITISAIDPAKTIIGSIFAFRDNLVRNSIFVFLHPCFLLLTI